MPWRPPEYEGEFPTLGWLVCDWIEENCVIPDGEFGGEPFKLTEEMQVFLAHHYRLKLDAEDGQLATAFHYRRSILVRPQKWGKGPLTAAMICAEAVGPSLFAGWDAAGEPVGKERLTPRIQIAATTDDQTANVYGHLVPMILRGPLADQLDAGLTRVMIPGGGIVEPVTSKATSRLGAPISFAVMDETGVWNASNRGHDLAKTLRRGLAGMGGRSIETTNAWDPSERSVAQVGYESKVPDVYRDYRQPPANLSYRNKAERRKIHKGAYGDSWWVDLDGIEAEAAEIMETDPANAERFFGNRVVAGSDAWADGDKWDARKSRRDHPPARTQVVLGFDGSDIDDWTAIRAETQDGYQFTPTTDDGPTIWNPAEFDGQVPRTAVSEAVEWLFKHYDVIRMYADPPYWSTELDAWAAKYGEKRVIPWYTSRPRQMTAASDRLLTDVAKTDSEFTHDGCEHTAEHVRNARKIRRDGAIVYKLAKPSDGRKIDLAVVSILAHEAAGDATAAKLWRRKSYAYAE